MAPMALLPQAENPNSMILSSQFLSYWQISQETIIAIQLFAGLLPSHLWFSHVFSLRVLLMSVNSLWSWSAATQWQKGHTSQPARHHVLCLVAGKMGAQFWMTHTACWVHGAEVFTSNPSLARKHSWHVSSVTKRLLLTGRGMSFTQILFTPIRAALRKVSSSLEAVPMTVARCPTNVVLVISYPEK